MSEGVIDVATFRGLETEAGAEFVAELVAAFLEEAPAMMEALRAALATRNEEAFRRTAHSLKSNSLTFGANALAALARELEARSHELLNASDAGAIMLDALTAEHARVAAELRELASA